MEGRYYGSSDSAVDSVAEGIKQCGNIDPVVVDGKGRLPMRRLLQGGCSSRKR